MSCFNCEWLGYVSSPEEAIKFIKDTGVFYLSISIAYLLSFLYMSCHSPATKKIKRIHILGVLMWAFMGGTLIIQPGSFSIFFNLFISLLSLLVLYQLQYTSALTAHSPFSEPKTDDKKALYGLNLLKRMNYTLADIVGFTLINEQILWFLILYRSAITVHAAWGL
ncbi:MAG: hypothetical protein FJX71_06890 [Alphaproteobacteria bacterium]|nr:hypothetical protein [Alphaproteobacteria bacterium]